MSGSYERRYPYHEYSPGFAENRGSKHMQTSGVSQDASIYEYHHAYRITPQHPSQSQSQPPAHYTTRRPTQKSIKAPDEYLDEYSDSVGGFQHNFPVEHLEDPPVVDRVKNSINDPIQYRCQIWDGHEAQGGYPTAGTAPVAGSFEDLSLTAPSSWEAHDQLSDQATALQSEYPGASDGKRPCFPHPDSNPYGPLAQNITGLELPGNEPLYLTPDIWWVRMSVAHGRDLNEIAEELRRTTASVLKFIEEHKLPWTPLQDNQLREMKVDEHSVMSTVRPGLIENEYHYDFEILARANYLKLLDDFARQVSEDDTLQYGSHQDDVDIQYARSAATQASQEYGVHFDQTAGTDELEPDTQRLPVDIQRTEPVEMRHKPKRKAWAQTEVTKLEEWVAHHGRGNWENVEKELPGRTAKACATKWRDYTVHGPRSRKRNGEAIQPSFGNDSSSQKHNYSNFKGLLEPDLDFLKFSLARGAELSAVIRQQYANFGTRTMIKFVYFGGWSPWTPEQDQKLLQMRDQGDDDWAGMSNKLHGPKRSKEEVAYRINYLTRVEHGELPWITGEPACFFYPEDDAYIRRAVARGITFAEMCEEEFPDLTPERVEERARAICAI